MKRIILIAIALIVQSNCYAQYQSIFGDSLTEWAVAQEIPDAVLTISPHAKVDTILNGHNYKQFYVLQQLSYIREDRDSGKVWIYYPGC